MAILRCMDFILIYDSGEYRYLSSCVFFPHLQMEQIIHVQAPIFPVRK